MALNFWNDGNDAFNNMGVGYVAALESMNVGSLRYPGGEKSDSCASPVTPCHALLLGAWR